NGEIDYIYSMNRKDFLSAATGLGALCVGSRAAAATPASLSGSPDQPTPVWEALSAASASPGASSRASTPLPVSLPVLPPYLEAGDTVGITSPAGHISHERIAPA